MVPYVSVNQLRWLTRFTFFNMIINRVNEWVVYLPSGYFVGQRDARGMMWMAPCKSALFQSTSLSLTANSRSRSLCYTILPATKVARRQNSRLHLLGFPILRTQRARRKVTCPTSPPPQSHALGLQSVVAPRLHIFRPRLHRALHVPRLCVTSEHHHKSLPHRPNDTCRLAAGAVAGVHHQLLDAGPVRDQSAERAG